MRTYSVLPGSHKLQPRATRVQPRSFIAPKRNVTSLGRIDGQIQFEMDEALLSDELDVNPYVDYGRYLTPEGGVLITYKDLDQRLRCLLWRVLAWTVATGGAYWFFLQHSPVHAAWINDLCLLGLAIANWFIVRPLETYRDAEIRPDSLVLDNKHVFWLRLMENGLPTFREDKEGNLVLCGVYGTRFVEYLTVRRFDDNDKTPETFAAHFQEAIGQIWAPALAGGIVRPGSPPRQRF
jgi:hypothetical protein